MEGRECRFPPEVWRNLIGAPVPANWPPGIRGVHADSRRIRPGWVFVAIAGHAGDGHRFVEDAVRRGAVGVLAQEAVSCKVPAVQVPDVRAALSRISRAFYGEPDRDLRVTGVTGTNGKTSVAGFVHQLLMSSGVEAGLIGTVVYAFGKRQIPARRTTPGPPELYELLRSVRQEGCTEVVMEVSSHALDQDRVADLAFDTAVFTNLSRDHLDYHHNLEDYFAAKVKLFTSETLTRRIVGEDEWSERLVDRFGPEVLRCGLGEGCDLRATDLTTDVSGTSARIHTPWGGGEVHLGVPGTHNIRNLLQALAVVGGRGIAMDDLLRQVKHLQAAPGRLERVPCSRGRIFVDYAHTPDALDNVLATLRPLTSGTLRVVFGCGGDRDRSKRAPMVEAALRYADQVYLTSDNPRTEDPKQIFADMRKGLQGGEPVSWIPDRAGAIETGVAGLEEGDVLLIAGKGHETVQEVGHQQVPFDDRHVALNALEKCNADETGMA